MPSRMGFKCDLISGMGELDFRMLNEFGGFTGCVCVCLGRIGGRWKKLDVAVR